MYTDTPKSDSNIIAKNWLSLSLVYEISILMDYVICQCEKDHLVEDGSIIIWVISMSNLLSTNVVVTVMILIATRLARSCYPWTGCCHEIENHEN